MTRTVVIAGAGIGGLTAALTLAARGFRIIVMEKAERLEEAGAGLQLSPNASRMLVDLGLAPRLAARAVVPEAVSIMSVRAGGEIARLPLGEAASRQAGAPYWVVHRADLQAALAGLVNEHADIDLRLGCQFEQTATDAAGLRVTARRAGIREHESAAALIGADGIWSSVRQGLHPGVQPIFSGLIAWRGTLDAERLSPEYSSRCVQLWMGPDAHLVAYPVSAGRQVNVVAIVGGSWSEPGWSAPGDAGEIRGPFAASRWPAVARTLIDAIPDWRRWALFTLPDIGRWSTGAVALLGDAAHAMLPFAAQGAGMAIEDAAVLAQCLDADDDSSTIPAALRRYTELRRARVRRVEQTARRNGRIYHLTGPAALARDLTIRALGPARMLARQDWIYGWRA